MRSFVDLSASQFPKVFLNQNFSFQFLKIAFFIKLSFLVINKINLIDFKPKILKLPQSGKESGS